METSLHNLLVVEDNPFIGQKIIDAVKKFSSIQTVYKSETIEEAFAFLKKTNFEIITLDLSLPDGSGLEILKWLKENHIKKKVFVFSTHTELKQVCLKYGAYAFFDKATGFEELIKSLRNV